MRRAEPVAESWRQRRSLLSCESCSETIESPIETFREEASNWPGLARSREGPASAHVRQTPCCAERSEATLAHGLRAAPAYF